MATHLSARNKRRIGIFLIASFLLALSGIYSSSGYPFYMRWLYWAALVGLGIWLNDALSRQLTPFILRFPWVIRWLIFASVLSLPMFTFVAAIEGLWGSPIPPDYYLDAGFKVWVVTAVITAFGMRSDEQSDDDMPAPSPLAEKQETQAPEPRTNGGKDTSVRIPATLLKRANPALQNTNLMAVTAEDHYVRVYTDKGEDLLLLRFADAMTETEPVDGLQVHRSWWVAKDAVASAHKKSTGSSITLLNGVQVPISRRRLAAVEEAGWFNFKQG